MADTPHARRPLPTKRCGKTTLLTSLSKLCKQALPVSNISPAALFRSIELFRPTFLIDEGDTFLRDNEELRGIINSGHTRATAFVIRCVGDNNTPTRFSTWCPRAIAMIGSPPDTIADRSITVHLRRKLAGESTAIHADEHEDLFRELRAKIIRWVEDNQYELRSAAPARLDTKNDRQADNFRPVLAIAVVADIEDEARKAARKMIGDDQGETPAKEQLLSDVLAIFDTKRAERLPSAEIVKALVEMEDRPWPEWRHGHPITAPGLAKLLRPFGIHPKQMKFDHNAGAKGYEKSGFEDICARYTPVLIETPKYSNDNDELQDSSNRNHSETSRNRNYVDEFQFRAVSGTVSQSKPSNHPELLPGFGVSVAQGGGSRGISVPPPVSAEYLDSLLDEEDLEAWHR